MWLFQFFPRSRGNQKISIYFLRSSIDRSTIGLNSWKIPFDIMDSKNVKKSRSYDKVAMSLRRCPQHLVRPKWRCRCSFFGVFWISSLVVSNVTRPSAFVASILRIPLFLLALRDHRVRCSVWNVIGLRSFCGFFLLVLLQIPLRTTVNFLIILTHLRRATAWELRLRKNLRSSNTSFGSFRLCYQFHLRNFVSIGKLGILRAR